MPLLTVMIVSQAVGLMLVAVFVIAGGRAAPGVVHLLPAAGAGIAGVVALTAFYRALAIGTMSIVAPISATGVAVPVVFGIAHGDRPTALQLAGIVAATIGVVLASREHGPGIEAPADSRRSFLLALVAALGFGAFFVGLQASARHDVAWALVVSRGCGVLLLTALALVRRPAVVTGGVRAWVPMIVMGVLDVSANAFYALATRHGLLSVVAVASSLYPLATVALARVLLGERVRRVQEVGIAAAVAGVVLIGAG